MINIDFSTNKHKLGHKSALEYREWCPFSYLGLTRYYLWSLKLILPLELGQVSSLIFGLNVFMVDEIHVKNFAK